MWQNNSRVSNLDNDYILDGDPGDEFQANEEDAAIVIYTHIRIFDLGCTKRLWLTSEDDTLNAGPTLRHSRRTSVRGHQFTKPIAFLSWR